jgi:hypothetical protein
MGNRQKDLKGNLKSMISLVLALTVTSGCATSTVLGRPAAKNMNALNAGTSRGMVLTELGAPTYTREVDGEKQDTFSFDKGVNGGYKFGRGFFHIAADIFTLFLWEIVAWPAEKIAAGPNTKVDVGYDKDEKVKTVKYL